MSSKLDANDQEKLALLKTVSLFEFTKEETLLQEFVPILKKHELSAWTKIFRAGDAGDEMFIIGSGSVRIDVDDLTITMFEEKGFFGEFSLLDRAARSANATTTSETVLYSIKEEDFTPCLNAHPEVKDAIIKILCKRLRRQNQFIVGLRDRGDSRYLGSDPYIV